MAEIVFPCKCAMILKVYGDDQIGQGIVCPSCGSTVIVPPVGIAVDEQAPLVSDGPAAPPTSMSGMSGKWLGLGYLAGVGVVTLGLIKYILMPALAPPVAVPQVALAQNDEPEVPTKESESDDAPRRLLKKPRGRTLTESAEPGEGSRKTEAKRKSSFASPSPPTAARKDRGATTKRVPPPRPRPPDESEKSDDSDTAPPPEPTGGLGGLVPPGFLPGGPRRRPGRLPGGPPGGGMGKAAPRGLPPPPGGIGGGLGRTPAKPRGGLEPADEPSEPDESPDPSKPIPAPNRPGSDTETPAKARRLPKDDPPAKTAKKSTTKKSEYEHIENKEARKLLEAAALNTTNYLATYTAENFLRIAEKLGEGDPEVLAEIKKLRKKIADMRK